MFKKISLALAIGISLIGYVNAEEAKVDNTKEISSQMTKFFGGDITNFVSETNLPNAYLVNLKDGTNMIYFKDSNFAVVGDMYNLQTQKNVSRSLMSSYNEKVINEFANEGIKFPVTSTDKPVERVYVFTDPTCGYCRKLHHERDQYAANGIELVYLPYSRSGEDTFSYNELVDVFCSKDKAHAMDLAKSDKGEEIKTLEGYAVNDACKNEVAISQEGGRRLGISGTPALFTSDGHFFPGYVEASKLRAYINEARK